MTAKRALITGITGQDGSYLAELLLARGYEVHGIVRRVASPDPAARFQRLQPILDRITLHSASLENYASLCHIVQRIDPDECYHLAAQSFVSYSFDDEFSTIYTNVQGTHHILGAIKEFAPACRFFFAGTSEMFGKVRATPQNEETPFHPRSSYGISKVTGFELTRNYREAHDLFACSAICFNHESPRRGYEFVTRKITRAVARIKTGKQEKLRLGNLDARRDWGYAKEYVEAMWRMLQQDAPEDFVIATGQTHSVQAFAEEAFDIAGLNWQEYVISDQEFFRPAEVNLLCGDASRARQTLGWEAATTFHQLVELMVQYDLEDVASRR